MNAIPIIDGHHHIWRLADLAWLSGPQVPRIFGPYEPIFLIARLAQLPATRRIRQQLHWHQNPQYRFAPRPDVMNDAHLAPRSCAARQT